MPFEKVPDGFWILRSWLYFPDPYATVPVTVVELTVPMYGVVVPLKSHASFGRGIAPPAEYMRLIYF
jgi:hypothetical protein